MRITRAARANLRIWWKELTYLAITGALCLTTKDGLTGYIIVTGFSAGLWLMGFSHRHMPIFQVIRRMDAKLDEALAADDRPDAEIRRLHSV